MEIHSPDPDTFNAYDIVVDVEDIAVLCLGHHHTGRMISSSSSSLPSVPSPSFSFGFRLLSTEVSENSLDMMM